MLREIRHIICEVISGVTAVAYPNVCICCGIETTEGDRQLCSFCRDERFQDANPENSHSSSAVILPEGVVVQHALWQFDRGGVLQDLMHYLKYERLTAIGRELGLLVGQRMQKHPVVMERLDEYEAILVPVPLHYLKLRQRGFNQAFLIARGIQEVLGIPVCGHKDVVRSRNTESQTGYSIRQRIENVRHAFTVRNTRVFNGKMGIIVDDVFTTGATTFELALALRDAGCSEMMIVTAAQA